MNEEKQTPKTPLTMVETAAKLREKPHYLICNEEDSFNMLMGLIRYGFYFVPVGKHWEIFDTQDTSVKAELYVSSHCEKGQNYVIEVPKPIFVKPVVFNPPTEDENVFWERFLRYS